MEPLLPLSGPRSPSWGNFGADPPSSGEMSRWEKGAQEDSPRGQAVGGRTGRSPGRTPDLLERAPTDLAGRRRSQRQKGTEQAGRLPEAGTEAARAK